MDRKHFVISTSAAAYAALAWIRDAGRLGAFAANAAAAPDTHAVALSIVRAILPFEHPRFPVIAAADLRRRMYDLFSLDRDENFAATLGLFNSVGAWSNPPKPVIQIESVLYGPPDVAHDVRSFESWSGTASVKRDFTDLDLADQRSYLSLWAQSSFGMRRRVYQSFKALVNATAYSMDAMWSAIGYEGPLLPRMISP
jgi:hypothetical protein